ncbi:glycoside hydrolase family 2 TIM barrel-domain containing protein [Flavobacterium sp. LHD-80]|uniref:glycoside hydrolase family 2 TIM barrel-domain containing protein n=1 Tax=Flavobacterium sp. LHD-80 TaxID=3071411 RepID=UPI0027DEFBC1|nr:glycoside hydrolase family 2 TIM barrel-domain containing protein [Flavobacterium sp. LHD-80]MDQ6473010.1 glycoside hydrolase family 2 TIM barrel-domain containing protein [Flavobacterium sp. LHD-80]
MIHRKIIFLWTMLAVVTGFSQEKIKQSINSNWQFYKGKAVTTEIENGKNIDWEDVNLPHSWNKFDVMDDQWGYYRGEGWYKKTVFVNPSWKNKSVYLYFEGASQTAEVYINGKKVGSHIGGYNFFSFPINDFLQFDNPEKGNQIVVKVDNSYNENIPPLDADFTFYGGIYRDVYLVATNEIHFDMSNKASDGVFVTTPSVSASSANFQLKGIVENASKVSKDIKITTKLFDENNVEVANITSDLKLKPNSKTEFKKLSKAIPNPKLWSPDQPTLYKAVSVILDKKTKQQLDLFSAPVGFRWFEFTADKGFFLNGKPTKLIGANRHQDYKDLANALPDALADKDMQLIKDMGGNFVRVAHYPQDPTVLETCDRIGLLAMVETPEVNRITETKEFEDNSLEMQREMIRQSFNHPSVIVWAYMNEILLRPRYDEKLAERQAYYKNVAALAQKLENLTREEDPSRYTMIPNHGAFDLYNSVGLTKIPMVVGWNLYQGWYSGEFGGLEKYLERHHQVLPDKPVVITEFGADADRRMRSQNPQKFDKTMEYAMLYHKHYLNAIENLDYVAGGTIWNLVEFNSEGRAESWPHMNNKGIISWDRIPKDAYYFYQARLSKKPVVSIGSKAWTHRSGVLASENDDFYAENLEVFSNEKEITLKVNGQTLGSQKTKEGSVIFKVPFKNGANLIEAYSASNENVKDFVSIDYTLYAPNLNSKKYPFENIRISLGDKRQYTDELTQQNWLPEQEYKVGSWGYVGGQVYKMPGNPQIPYGTNKLIKGTENDPIYQTQREGIEAFNFDVPDGKYEVTLYFAELVSGNTREALAYNLAEKSVKEEKAFRVFDVLVNGELFLENFGNQNYLEPEKAVDMKTTVFVKDGKGIRVDFKAKTGKTILNGIELKRIF